MKNPRYPHGIPSYALHAIEKLDKAISSHAFRPQYLLVEVGLRSALEEAGRLKLLIMEGHIRAWVLDQDITVLEDPNNNDEYWFHLQDQPIFDNGTT